MPPDRSPSRRRRRASRAPRGGVVLAVVLMLLLAICFASGLLSRFAVRSSALARRKLVVQRAFVAAEAGLGYGVMSVRALLADGGIQGFNIGRYRIAQPESPDPDLELRLLIVPLSGSFHAGASTTGRQEIEIVAGARDPETGIACVLREVLTVQWTSLGDYAAFYEGDLEVHPGATMSFAGRVHSNGSVYAGGNVVFGRNISCAGAFYNRRKETGARNGTGVQVRFGDDERLDASEKDSLALVNTYDSASKSYVDSELGHLWLSRSSLRYGGAVQTGDHGIRPLKPPISVEDDNRSIIERPLSPIDIDYKESTESQKFANKAALRLRVYPDGSYVLRDRAGNDLTSRLRRAALATGWTDDGRVYHDKDYSTGAYRFATATGENGAPVSLAGGIQTDNAFYDQRECAAMQATDLYLDQILGDPVLRTVLQNAPGGDSGLDKILYVEMDEPLGHPVVTERTEKVKTGERWVEEYTTDPVYAYDYTDYGTDRYGRKVYRYYDPVTRRWRTTTSPIVAIPGETVPGHYEDVFEDAVVAETNFVPVRPCVRIRNAASLGGLDLSIVSSRPVYIEGSFNTDGSSGWAGQAPSSSALVAGDAVTVLSRNWHDAWCLPDWAGYRTGGASALGRTVYPLSRRTPSETTVNAVLMTGIVPTAGSSYSGGLENVFRFLENWRGLNCIFNGSIICMWNSEESAAQWPGTDVVYSPPNRKWGYSRMEPPGIPNLFDVRETEWSRVSWGDVDWDSAEWE